MSLFKINEADDWRKEYINKYSSEESNKKRGKRKKEKVYALNVHGKSFRLADNLSLICFGGSHPATQNDKNIWRGYPYNSEEEITKDMVSSLQSSLTEVLLSSVGKEALFLYESIVIY